MNFLMTKQKLPNILTEINFLKDYDMELIVYSRSNHWGKKFRNAMDGSLKAKIMMVSEPDSLFELARKAPYGQGILVLIITSEKEIEWLVGQKSRLMESSCIVILEKKSGNIFSKSLLLYPRFITHASLGFKDVAAVLSKRIKNQEKK